MLTLLNVGISLLIIELCRFFIKIINFKLCHRKKKTFVYGILIKILEVNLVFFPDNLVYHININGDCMWYIASNFTTVIWRILPVAASSIVFSQLYRYLHSPNRSGNKTKQQRKQKYSTDTIAASSMSSHHQSLTLLHSKFYDTVGATVAEFIHNTSKETPIQNPTVLGNT